MESKKLAKWQALMYPVLVAAVHKTVKLWVNITDYMSQDSVHICATLSATPINILFYFFFVMD